MYCAKREERNTYRFFTPELNTAARRRLELETHLRHACERDELTLHYQPQVICSENDGDDIIVGVEALLRWNSPELGAVRPDEFIPVAENTGLISPIGAWVLETACRQMKLWLDDGLRLSRMSVNVSPFQVRRDSRSNLCDTVARALSAANLPAELLELELTESLLVENRPYTRGVLDSVRNLGVNLAIDDFGTGYSAISYLRSFPFGTLKIDQSFVRDMVEDADTALLVSAIIAMGQGLGLRIVAEGVENTSQRSFLHRRRCDLQQGYLFGRPLPAAEIVRLLEHTRRQA